MQSAAAVAQKQNGVAGEKIHPLRRCTVLGTIGTEETLIDHNKPSLVRAPSVRTHDNTLKFHPTKKSFALNKVDFVPRHTIGFFLTSIKYRNEAYQVYF